MDRTDLLQELAALRFTASLPAAALERLAAVATVARYAAGARIFREGSTNDRLMIIRRGRVALDMCVPGRGEVRILSLAAGDLLAWSALLGAGRMTATATALEETEVLAIPAAEIATACRDPDFGYAWMQRLAAALAERLLATRLQLLDLFADAEPVARD
ncbi:MAG: cyclic nucleotide-binding domain-containing protein [Planctomycetaceae bacterium]|nr:cyclic nucleotide-binding domain-containing protein [Planctomycetaceae bacterium]